MIAVMGLVLSVIWFVWWLVRGYDDTNQLYVEVGATWVAASVAAGFWAIRHTK
jgi:hypothetical protein